MSETAWAHLPNARLIDEMLADTYARRKVWEAAYMEVAVWLDHDTRHTAWALAVEECDDDLYTDTMAAIDSVEPSEVWNALTDVIFALIAWPSSADLLSLTPDALRTIIDTCDGDVKHQAVLLLPAVIARSTV